MEKSNNRQANGFKHCSQTYITYKNVFYQQWADCDTKADAKVVIERSAIENPKYKFMLRKRDNFYRVYFTELKNQ